VFRWEDFLDLAHELASRPGEEGALRTAISRAYYAAFHTGRSHLAQAGVGIDRTGRAHQRVRDELGARDLLLEQFLFRLHDWRKQADYDDECTFDLEETAADAVALAQVTIERIRSLS
jgi:uncharacterized protein (UPF0332 family)